MLNTNFNLHVEFSPMHSFIMYLKKCSKLQCLFPPIRFSVGAAVKHKYTGKEYIVKEVYHHSAYHHLNLGELTGSYRVSDFYWKCALFFHSIVAIVELFCTDSSILSILL